MVYSIAVSYLWPLIDIVGSTRGTWTASPVLVKAKEIGNILPHFYLQKYTELVRFYCKPSSPCQKELASKGDNITLRLLDVPPKSIWNQLEEQLEFFEWVGTPILTNFEYLKRPEMVHSTREMQLDASTWERRKRVCWYCCSSTICLPTTKRYSVLWWYCWPATVPIH